MRYKNIGLNNNNGPQYSLVKYEEKYKKYLKTIKKLDTELAKSIEKCPK